VVFEQLAPLIGMLGVAAAAAILWQTVRGIRTRRTGGFEYDAGPGLLSPAEKACFDQLVSLVGHYGHVCPKVRIADLVKVRSAFLSQRDRMAALGRIAQKHVDFVVIDPTGRTAFALELDDRSHDRRATRKRDAFVNEVFDMAGIDLVRVRPRGLRSSDRLSKALGALRSTDLAETRILHAAEGGY